MDGLSPRQRRINQTLLRCVTRPKTEEDDEAQLKGGGGSDQ